MELSTYCGYAGNFFYKVRVLVLFLKSITDSCSAECDLDMCYVLVLVLQQL